MALEWLQVWLNGGYRYGSRVATGMAQWWLQVWL